MINFLILMDPCLVLMASLTFISYTEINRWIRLNFIIFWLQSLVENMPNNSSKVECCATAQPIGGVGPGWVRAGLITEDQVNETTNQLNMSSHL